jgi:hypothetical protein
MQYVEDRYHLRVDFQAKECDIPQDELTRMQQLLEPIGEAVQDFPTSELFIEVLHHPREEYHVEAKLKVPTPSSASASCRSKSRSTSGWTN